jgi:hypothetical protein
MKPKRPKDMSAPRYDWLLDRWRELCAVTGVSPEDAEAEMNAPGFLDDWEARLDRISKDTTLAALAKRSLCVGIAEGDPEATALAETPEGRELFARSLPKLPSH